MVVVMNLVIFSFRLDDMGEQISDGAPVSLLPGDSLNTHDTDAQDCFREAGEILEEEEAVEEEDEEGLLDDDWSLEGTSMADILFPLVEQDRMELLELEMRARAIKAMLALHEQREKEKKKK